MSGSSRRIMSLEQLVGADLFDRTRRSLALTPAGHQFHALALNVLINLVNTDGTTDLRFLSARFKSDVLPKLRPNPRCLIGERAAAVPSCQPAKSEPEPRIRL